MIKRLIWVLLGLMILNSGFVQAADQSAVQPAPSSSALSLEEVPASASGEVIKLSDSSASPGASVGPELAVETTAQQHSLPPDLAKQLSQLKPHKESGGSDIGASYGEMVLGLSAVLLLIFGLAWVARRLNVTAMSASPASLKLQSVLSLGNKEKVVIINAEGRRFLLGVTAQQISILSELDEVAESQAGNTIANLSFAQQIKQALQQGKVSEHKKVS